MIRTNVKNEYTNERPVEVLYYIEPAMSGIRDFKRKEITEDQMKQLQDRYLEKHFGKCKQEFQAASENLSLHDRIYWGTEAGRSNMIEMHAEKDRSTAKTYAFQVEKKQREFEQARYSMQYTTLKKLDADMHDGAVVFDQIVGFVPIDDEGNEAFIAAFAVDADTGERLTAKAFEEFRLAQGQHPQQIDVPQKYAVLLP